MYYGEIISRASVYLRGKHKPIYDRRKSGDGQGDIVIVVNADKITMPGRRLRFKCMRYHTGHPGGLKTVPFTLLMHRKPEYVFYRGVYKQLPKNKQRFATLKNLYVYTGPEVKYASFLPSVGSPVHARPARRQIQKNGLFADRKLAFGVRQGRNP